ncbi:MAG: hypothetical protein AB1489_27125 [Acidobacteriota bacterium]
MPAKKSSARKVSVAKTKQEMLDTYNELQPQLQEKLDAELKPEERLEEKGARMVIATADGLSTESIGKEIGSLKSEIGHMLTQITDSLEAEINKYQAVKKAIEAKEKDLQEIYEIERSASTLVALLEAQHQKRQEFEDEMAASKESLNQEIESLRAQWQEEKKRHESEIKERDMVEQKRREREKEEYQYAFNREKQLTRDKFEDEKAALERELQEKREQRELIEKESTERERALVQKEEEFKALQKRVEAFPQELEVAINKAVKENTDRLQSEAKNKEELLRKEFEGERKVLSTRIESLEQMIKEQSEQIAKLSQQLERSYSQVQDIAVKAIDGSSNFKSFTSLQQLMAEQTRRQQQDK